MEQQSKAGRDDVSDLQKGIDDKLKLSSAPQLSGLDRESKGLPSDMKEGITRGGNVKSESDDVSLPKRDIGSSLDKSKDVDKGVSHDECVVEVTNISPKVSKHELCQLFECCGEIVECELISHESTNRFIPDDGTQTAKLTFATTEAADVAELLSGALLAGQSVKVQRCKDIQPVEEGEHPTEKQWGYIRRLGEMTGQGYVIGQNAINYLVWFDEKYKISKSLGEKVHQLDERSGLTSSLSSVIAAAKDRWREVEQTHPNVVKAEEMLSSSLSVAGEKVSATAEMLKSTTMSSPIVNRGSEVLGEFTSAVQETIGAGNVVDQDQQQEVNISKQQQEVGGDVNLSKQQQEVGGDVNLSKLQQPSSSEGGVRHSKQIDQSLGKEGGGLKRE